MPSPSERIFVLTTSLGQDLFLQAMSGHEEVSGLFQYDVWALSTSSTISANDLLGRTASVLIQLADASKRHIHGYVTSFGIDGVMGRYHRYRLTLRPWLWMLTRTSNIRIFQDKSAQDIVKSIINAHGGTLEERVSSPTAVRPYCVQYRETDFNFVSRLLEEEGINYHFVHTESSHKMVLTDRTGRHEAYPGHATAPYAEDDGGSQSFEYVRAWTMSHEIRSGKVVLRDYHYETPDDTLQFEATASRSHARADGELYDFPGGYTAAAGGNRRAPARLDETQSRFARFAGESNLPWLCAGRKFTLGDHPRADQNVEYIALSTDLTLQLSGYEASSDPGTAELETSLRCEFTAQPTAEPLVPQRRTPRPQVAGPQTAFVTGGSDGAIVTDEHGRVKVHFPWDRAGTKTAGNSCWLRVASPSAGNGWGFFSLPRCGQEVVVDFIEGDPDRPLVTGRVHNPTQKTPYELPANATVSTWKSRSKNGGAADFNELRFEDKPGSEYLLLHAQKDRLEFVENVLKSKIDQSEHRTVGADRKEKISGTHHLNVVGETKWKFDAKLNLQSGADMLFKSGGQFSLNVGAAMKLKAAGIVSLDTSDKLQVKTGADVGLQGGANVHIKGAANIVIEAGAQITLKAGPASIVIGPDGVSVTGPMVKLNSGGSPGSGSGASPEAPVDPAAPDAPEAATDPLSHR